ncbi:unnamed protein product [Gadus morhua 'NCC']
MRQKIREDTGRCVPAEGLIQHPPRALPTICCEHEIESRRPLRFRGIMKGGLALGFNLRAALEAPPSPVPGPSPPGRFRPVPLADERSSSKQAGVPEEQEEQEEEQEEQKHKYSGRECVGGS